MKHLIKTSFIFLLFVAVSSCSKEDVNEQQSLHGVWDNVQITDNQTDIIRLVFGEDNTGLLINRVELAIGGVTSVTESFSWINTDGVVEIDNNKTYIMNAQGQLVSSASSELILDKVSDDYLKYY
ncbi:hypothetical protein [Hyunsoonleella pacifica]|uniref:Lipocalin-like domain-containing protein n=1 Tax=Hyunsoonleella pacifica TaxID=1080224 RepID=A0A4Q9FMH8_9FLAO|nr:hypothetical protein [Hyunsoonleella pacifica]TBN15410.1 hypothetical protein EYD46_09730 [Hyunsoonleella pacifica]GGD23848.1 hypothetical protein GCM10011368_27370 [Hyunsoonleella pacifica]